MVLLCSGGRPPRRSPPQSLTAGASRSLGQPTRWLWDGRAVGDACAAQQDSGQSRVRRQDSQRPRTKRRANWYLGRRARVLEP
jgi:hypothetical protein